MYLNLSHRAIAWQVIYKPKLFRCFLIITNFGSTFTKISTMNLSTNQASSAFQAFCQSAAERATNLKTFENLDLAKSSEDKQDSESPIFDPFFRRIWQQ